MQLTKGESKNWNDYSDSSEEQPEYERNNEQQPRKGEEKNKTKFGGSTTTTTIDHRTPEYTQMLKQQMKEIPFFFKDVWVELYAEDQTYLDKKIMEFKGQQSQDISLYFINKDKKCWDLKIKKTLLEQWIKDGVDSDKNIRIALAEKNFKKGDNDRERNGDRNRGRGNRGRDNRGQRRERGGDRGQRGQRGDRRGRGRGDRNRQQGGDRPRRDRNREGGEERKKKYVDKQTGEAPKNKQSTEQQLMEEKQRLYSKQEAERKGKELGNFRNKSKLEETAENGKTEVIEQVPVVEKDKKKFEREYPKKPKQVWARKDKTDKVEDSQKEKPKFVQKKDDGEGNDKKKKYVRVDNVTEAEKEEIRLKKSTPVTHQEESTNQMLSEDR